jgi:hypothetical protein
LAPKGFSARGDDAKPGSPSEELAYDFCHRIDDVLAVVEKEKQVSIGERGRERASTGDRTRPEGRGEPVEHVVVRHSGEIDEYSVRMCRRYAVSHGNSKSGLADTTGPDERDHGARRDRFDETVLELLPADHSRRAGKIGNARLERRLVRLRQTNASNALDERVATADRCRDEAATIATVAQHLPQAGDVDANVDIVDDHITPDTRDEIVSGDEIASITNKHEEHIECAASDLDQRAGFV